LRAGLAVDMLGALSVLLPRPEWELGLSGQALTASALSCGPCAKS